MALRNIQIDIDNAVFQAAFNRAARDRKTIGEIVSELLSQYANDATTAASTTYTVQRGDSLGRIARTVYGDARQYPRIQRANNISDPSRIWVGQVLIIPAIDGGTATPTTSPAPTPSPAPAPAPTPAPAPRPPSLPVTPAPPPPPTATPPPLPTFRPAVTTPPPAPAPTPAIVTAAQPAKPAIRWVGSPNFNQRRNPNDVTAITIHSTANSTLGGVITWFNNPNAQVSAHYTIGKDGTIVQHVRDQDRAWHAGRSIWKGRASCNDFCLGIELVNLNDGVDTYPEAQHQATVALCAYLCATHNISPDDIMGHLDIAIPTGRKSDPRGYDLNRLRSDIAARLGR